MKEFTIPNYPMYTVTEDGTVYSSYGKEGKPRRQLKISKSHKRHSNNRVYCYVYLQVPGENRCITSKVNVSS